MKENQGTELDQETVGAFVDQIQQAMMGSATMAMAHLGDRLGLYAALAEAGAATPAELADRTGCAERYLREWSAQQTAVGFLDHDAETGRFTLIPEHAFVLAIEESPASFAGGIESITGFFQNLDRVADAFRTGDGVPWGDQHAAIHRGTARFFGTAYRASLLTEWVPALGLNDRLVRGVRVADVGCGHGVSTILLAEQYPQSTFVGIDPHGPSITAARRLAAEAGVADRVAFTAGTADDLEETYDVIWFFDSLHDLGDPVAALKAANAHLADDGVVVLVEPFAHDDPANNMSDNPLAGLHYAASTLLCVPNSLSQSGQVALGGQAGGAVLGDVLADAGFTTVHTAHTTPVHAVYGARR